MEQTIFSLTQGVVFTPLIGAIIAGCFGKLIGRRGAHCATIAGVAISFVLSLIIAKYMLLDSHAPVNQNLYTWASSIFTFSQSNLLSTMHVGFLVDGLTALMMVTVTFVSLLVHIYSVGYMADDDGNRDQHFPA